MVKTNILQRGIPSGVWFESKTVCGLSETLNVQLQLTPLALKARGCGFESHPLHNEAENRKGFCSILIKQKFLRIFCVIAKTLLNKKPRSNNTYFNFLEK
jgi:hypothetical protein